MVLCFFHHCAELLLIKQGCDLTCQPSGGFTLLSAVFQKIAELGKLHDCLVVADLYVIKRHIDDEDDLLFQMIEGDHLVEQHQINVLEVLCILRVTFHAWFAVSEIIIGKIADQSAREGRQIIKTRTLVFAEDLPQICRRIIGFDLEVSELHFPFYAGDLHLWLKAEKGIPAPCFVRLSRFQHIAMCRNIFQDPHGFDGCGEIRQDLRAHRKYIVSSRCRDLLDLRVVRQYFHI